MALPEPQWPRPHRYRAYPESQLASAEDANDIIHKVDLRQHPLGRETQPQSLFPAVILLLLCALSSMWVWTHPDQDWLSATQRSVFQLGEFWRLLTTLAVHADIAHLLANGGLFLIFGLFLRQYFGLWAFPVLSLLGGMMTGAIALLTYGPDVRLIGASGMVYFMAALWLVLFFRYADYLSTGQRMMRALAFLLVVLVPTQFEPQVSYRTHAIGFALGLLWAWLGSPWMRPITRTTIQDDESSEAAPFALVETEEDLLP